MAVKFKEYEGLAKVPRGTCHHLSKMDDKTIRAILKLLDRGATLSYISEKFGISTNAAFRIKHRLTWKHVEWPPKPA